METPIKVVEIEMGPIYLLQMSDYTSLTNQRPAQHLPVVILTLIGHIIDH